MQLFTAYMLCRLFTVQGTHRGGNHASISLIQLCPGERVYLSGGKDDFADWQRGTVVLEAGLVATSMSAPLWQS